MNTSKDSMVITQPCGCTVGVGSGALDFCGLHAQAGAMRDALDLIVFAIQGANDPGDLAARLNSNVLDKARALLLAVEGR